eukprot:CAMPEP_0178887248 /NCGR_PEP_ID=MMETSP0747-20121128/16481_1 /TAXON_ID=913974 /ORGANISM="Nitzschia punctata, Strain CCMP561" /LENGTH=266 /DNA_ID=CAMNT_0020556367 /DNA_START=134 /DNA_END=934 /DNA_ORIENTATION=-
MAFSSTSAKTSLALRPTSALNVGITWEDYEDVASGDFMMHRAEACANSESCSLEEAQICLDEILHVQTQCVGGGVLSTTSVCDNADRVADTVAKLRQKIEMESQRLAPLRASLNIVNVVLGIVVVSMILHGVAADPNVPFDASWAAFSSNENRAVAPFSIQEFIWSVRDGYLPLLFSQYLKNGGLVVDAQAFDMKAVPFTPQEWVWSMQNGSLGRMLEESVKYGGLRVDSSYETETLPLTFQETWWALTNGYAGNAVQHVFRNGGL